MKNINLRDALETQIVSDVIKGDTTVLAEILIQLSDAYIFQCLGDEEQGQVNECYGSYAISTTDGHDIDWTYYDSELEAHECFIYMQGWHDDIHLYEYSEEFGYEVIKSFNVD